MAVDFKIGDVARQQLGGVARKRDIPGKLNDGITNQWGGGRGTDVEPRQVCTVCVMFLSQRS